MSTQSLTQADSKRICSHMNNDHKDAIIAYAKHYASLEIVSDVQMIDIKSHAMFLKVNGESVVINFDHKLVGREDAHQTLINMLNAIPKRDI